VISGSRAAPLQGFAAAFYQANLEPASGTQPVSGKKSGRAPADNYNVKTLRHAESFEKFNKETLIYFCEWALPLTLPQQGNDSPAPSFVMSMPYQ
jgi:hypothetical protein